MGEAIKVFRKMNLAIGEGEKGGEKISGRYASLIEEGPNFN